MSTARAAVVSPSPSEPGAKTSSADYFAVLGQPRRYDLDRDALEGAYLERAKQLHPDRFAGAPAGQRRRAMEASAALNEGYRVLRDPVRRAEYLCKLGGIDVDSSDPEGGAPKMGQGFLVEMIERREAVAEAHGQGASALDELRAEVDDEAEQALDDAIDALGDSSEDAIRRAAEALVKRRYLQRLLDEIDQAAESS